MKIFQPDISHATLSIYKYNMKYDTFRSIIKIISKASFFEEQNSNLKWK